MSSTQIKVTLNERQLEILDSFCDMMGMKRAYAIRFLIIDDLMEHRTKYMTKGGSSE